MYKITDGYEILYWMKLYTEHAAHTTTRKRGWCLRQKDRES